MTLMSVGKNNGKFKKRVFAYFLTRCVINLGILGQNLKNLTLHP